jgi:dUTP pyrophosphatase
LEKITIKFQRISDEFIDVDLPAYATPGSSGMDVRAALRFPETIAPGNVALIPTGLKVEIPGGYELQVRPRSGLAIKHSIGLLNSPGTIDSDYRGEVKIILFNFGKNDFTVNRGDRIAQFVVSKVYQAELVYTSVLTETERGEGGFGHTGQ